MKLPKKLLNRKITFLIIYPFSKVFYALSFSKRLQLNARACTLNASFSAICFWQYEYLPWVRKTFRALQIQINLKRQ